MRPLNTIRQLTCEQYQAHPHHAQHHALPVKGVPKIYEDRSNYAPSRSTPPPPKMCEQSALYASVIHSNANPQGKGKLHLVRVDPESLEQQHGENRGCASNDGTRNQLEEADLHDEIRVLQVVLPGHLVEQAPVVLLPYLLLGDEAHLRARPTCSLSSRQVVRAVKMGMM